jgi:hypothetical protein
MDPAWFELAGKVALFLFAVLVVALLAAGAAPAAVGRIGGFLHEYVGNAALGRKTAPHLGPPSRDSNGEARALLDRILRELERRHVAPTERETFLVDLQRAILSEERLHALTGAAREAERRFLATKRWALAERFHAMVGDPPRELVARIQSGFAAAQDGIAPTHDPDP